MMIWGRPAVEVYLGRPGKCDQCDKPALAIEPGAIRCEDHLTEEMEAYRRANSRERRLPWESD